MVSCRRRGGGNNNARMGQDKRKEKEGAGECVEKGPSLTLGLK